MNFHQVRTEAIQYLWKLPIFNCGCFSHTFEVSLLSRWKTIQKIKGWLRHSVIIMTASELEKENKNDRNLLHQWFSLIWKMISKLRNEGQKSKVHSNFQLESHLFEFTEQGGWSLFFIIVNDSLDVLSVSNFFSFELFSLEGTFNWVH